MEEIFENFSSGGPGDDYPGQYESQGLLLSTPSIHTLDASSSTGQKINMPLRYALEFCLQIRRTQPDLPLDAIETAVTESWEALNDLEKQTYLFFSAHNINALQSGTEPPAAPIVSSEQAQQVSHSGHVAKPRQSSPSKAPVTPFMRFSSAEQPRLQAFYPQASSRELRTMLHEQWELMDQTERRKYETEPANLSLSNIVPASQSQTVAPTSQPQVNSSQIQQEPPPTTAAAADMGKLTLAQWASLSNIERQAYLQNFKGNKPAAVMPPATLKKHINSRANYAIAPAPPVLGTTAGHRLTLPQTNASSAMQSNTGVPSHSALSSASESLHHQYEDPYVNFVVAQRFALRLRHPHATLADLERWAWVKWSALSETEKQAYAKTTKDNEGPKGSAAPNTAVPTQQQVKPAQPSVLSSTTTGPRASKPSQIRKQQREPTPYIVFCSIERPKLKAAHPTATFGMLGKMLGERWAALSTTQKAKYVPSKETAVQPPQQRGAQIDLTNDDRQVHVSASTTTDVLAAPSVVPSAPASSSSASPADVIAVDDDSDYFTMSEDE